MSHAWKKCLYREEIISEKFRRVFTCLQRTHLGLVMVRQLRVSPFDRLFHFLGCFGGPEPKWNRPRSPKLKASNREGQFYLWNYAFSSSNMWSIAKSSDCQWLKRPWRFLTSKPGTTRGEWQRVRRWWRRKTCLLKSNIAGYVYTMYIPQPVRAAVFDPSV